MKAVYALFALAILLTAAQIVNAALYTWVVRDPATWAVAFDWAGAGWCLALDLAGARSVRAELMTAALR